MSTLQSGRHIWDFIRIKSVWSTRCRKPMDAKHCYWCARTNGNVYPVIWMNFAWIEVFFVLFHISTYAPLVDAWVNGIRSRQMNMHKHITDTTLSISKHWENPECDNARSIDFVCARISWKCIVFVRRSALCLFQLCMQCVLHQFSYIVPLRLLIFIFLHCRCYVWRCCDSYVTFTKSTFDAFCKCLQHGKNIKSFGQLRQYGFDNFFLSQICVFVWHFPSYLQYETHWILHDFISSVTLLLFAECSKRHECSKQ